MFSHSWARSCTIKGRWKVWDTAQQARIEDRQTGARVRCIGSDPRRAHGLAPVLVLADEPSQWPETTGEAMLAALRTASGKQPHSRFVALGTRPADAEHWFAKMLTGGADYAQRHAAKAGDPPFQERTWRKANPSLTLMPDLLAAIRNEAIRARADPALLAGFEALRLNLGTTRRLRIADSGTAWAGSMSSAQAPPVAALRYRPSVDRASTARRAGRDPLRAAGAGGRGPMARSGAEGRPGDAGVPPAAFEARGMGYRDGAEDVRAFRRACADGKGDAFAIPAATIRYG